MDEEVYNTIIEELEYWEKRKNSLENLLVSMEAYNDSVGIPDDVIHKFKKIVNEEITICYEQISQISHDLEVNELKSDMVAKYGN